MSGLRRVLKKNPIPEEDVEAPKEKDSPTKTSAASAAASSSDSSSARSGHSPVFLAKVICQKVIALVSGGEEDGDETFGIISFLRDVIIGILVGLAMLSLLVFLDHRNIVHMESAHNFRRGAFQIMNDPETLATVEESSGLKFMTTEKYDSMLKEIETATNAKAEHGKRIQDKSNELEAKKKEVEAIRDEHARLMDSPLLGLNKFCGGCTWSGKTTCAARVSFLQNKYQSTTIDAKMNALLKPTCWTK